MCQGVVAGLLLQVVLVDLLVDPRNLVEHHEELIVEVGTQELHLGYALLCSGRAKLALAVLVKRYQRAVAARYGAIEAVPKLVEMAKGRREGREYLHRVIIGVGRAGAAFQAVVGREVAIRPKVERISVPAIAKHGVCACHHAVGVGIRLVLVNDTSGRIAEEIIA